ncbi:hypothetical protein I302_103127 [Kwoniella bestiolae CBS 10118]|uniref:Ribosomal RNA-processing protein 14/surfeit locus protein 6 C-terminal domain-containing protein n=1 Tax=Kwoniella bestiolae CBS 10118 TaxID=1296100 RepID=A0A1B9GH16_9TREE|nr:hypothetical protein I302_01827 [Kwoniella bestiolae CBS 10118]OCF30308.1 hypothetical protein I302_01827 [Kwoniella bestiolae CBS 10118]
MASSSTAITPTPRDDLLKSLEKHNSTFTTLLSLIPAQYYIAPDPEVADSKWMKNKKRKTGEEIKEHKKKVKQDKLDPSDHQTLDQLQFTSTAEPSNENDDGKIAEIAGQSTSSAANLQPLPPSTSISELRAKLQNKLDSFKRQRGVNPEDEAGSRNALEEERRRKRGELRDNRREKRKEERKKEGEKGRVAKTQLIVPQLPKEDPTSSLSFPSVSLPSSSSSKPKNKLGFKQLSNPTQALENLEKHKSHLNAMSEDKRKEIEERERWAKAEERASGKKIVDNETILKKAVKRKEKAKSKSSLAWADRKKELEKSAATAAKKRNDNIAKRVDDKRNKRLGIKDKGTGSKKGKSRPGFEGKKGKGGGKK